MTSNGVRLLIVTQAVDLDDPVLGFFHRWVEEFAKHCERVHIICLKEGRHALPVNVTVHSLGKETGRSRRKYLARFYRYVWSLRGEYEAVFVHMNEEYMLLSGILWRLMGKRIVLWRNHKTGSWRTRCAVLLAHTVCHTSSEAYVAHMHNAQQMPIGIDTDAFSPGTPPTPESILFLGRLDAVKKPDVFLEAMQQLVASHPSAHADIYGDPTPGREAYAIVLKERFAHLTNVTFHSGVAHERTPEIYHSHTIYVNLTPSGSFDKTIGEALASGCVVVAANDAVRDVLVSECSVNSHNPHDVARGISAALALSQEEREQATARGRAFVEREHSLALLVERLAGILDA